MSGKPLAGAVRAAKAIKHYPDERQYIALAIIFQHDSGLLELLEAAEGVRKGNVSLDAWKRLDAAIDNVRKP